MQEQSQLNKTSNGLRKIFGSVEFGTSDLHLVHIPSQKTIAPEKDVIDDETVDAHGE